MPHRMSLSPAAAGILMPMHVWLAPDTTIRRVGPTLEKLRADSPLAGRPFRDVFEIRRPRNACALTGLPQSDGTPLHLAFRDPPSTAFRGIVIALDGAQGALVNLSFGISVLQAVTEYGLTIGDFAATDLTVEMLYLVEAKSAVMEETRNLNQRLQNARIVAEEQAHTDTLTGLQNRRAMDHVLTGLIEAKRPFALMHLDLDFFKSVNDRHGHAAGDQVLRHAARILREETRHRDAVLRVGGDEFVLIFDDLVDAARLDAIACRIIARLEEPITIDNDICRISASIGTTLSTRYGRPRADTMLHDADMALYESKRQGRARATLARAPTVTMPRPAGPGSRGGAAQ